MSGQMESDAADLPQLKRTFDEVVAALGATGASGFRDLYVTVSGVHRGEVLGNLALVRGRLWLEASMDAVDQPASTPATDGTAERALLFASLCHVMYHWDLDVPAVSRFLDVPIEFVGSLASYEAVDEVPGLDGPVSARMRRLVVVENLRALAGVGDHAVADWLRGPQRDLGGRTVLSILLAEGECGFVRVLIWLLDQTATCCATVH